MADEQGKVRENYWEYDNDGRSPSPPLRECPLCPDGGQPYFTRTANGTNIIYVGCSQCGLALKAALIMVTPTEEQPSKDILTIWNTRRGDETGWLLEKMHNGNVHYISADYVLQWTEDPNKALRLARREDAEALSTIVEDCQKIAQHEWPKPRPADAV